jgi:outer membrane protein OmpA-like peptidoglycan-associated protein
VRAALTAGGIPAGAIQERWVGFHEPPVPTPMGVREPRNRVVEVTIQ